MTDPIDNRPIQPNTNNKLWVGGAAGALVIVIQWAMKTWGDVEMPVDVAMALSTIVSLAAAHITPIKDSELL